MADAVVIPGRKFGPASGILMYAAEVPESRGATVHLHSWSREAEDPFSAGTAEWACGEVRPVLDSAGGSPLLIGKSLGTYAAKLAAERELPAIWLTPLLTMPWVTEAMEQSKAPFLLVGGTADPLWDSRTAQRLSPYVLEVEGADHGMFVPGPVKDSVAVLGRIVDAIEEFLTGIEWP